MFNLRRWIGFLVGWTMLWCVSCSSPACPDCPVLELQFSAPKDFIIKNASNDAPVDGKTWGRVEILLSPEKGSEWVIPNDTSKLKQDGPGWVFRSAVNEKTSVEVAILGTLVEANIKVETINISVWMGKTDVEDLLDINKGLFVRLRLSALSTLNPSYNISGKVWRYDEKLQQDNKYPEVCYAAFTSSSKKFGKGNPPHQLAKLCEANTTTDCWTECPKTEPKPE